MPYLADFVLSFVAADRIPAHLVSYIPDKTPFSTWPAVISMTVTYLVVVFGTCETMRDKSPLKLTTLFRAHNLILSVGSLVLMALIGEEVFSNWLKPEIGTYGSLCATEAYTNRLEFYLMLNYYFKYYELLDTVFLALKKKPLSFLHVYHHAATMVLAFVQLNGRATVCWVAAFLNLGVHVLMYYYYYAAAGGAKLWWKKYLTTMQIAQFLVILASAAFASYQYAAYNWFPMYLPHMGGCSGTPTAGIVGAGIISSYLLLFIEFFLETYLRKAGSHGSVTWLRLAVQKHIKPSTAAPESLLFRMEKVHGKECHSSG
ncbi:GNS1/SUR4 membrane protein [Boletus reticuloceps]|uniref:Elongation of fatty acids protein n=1 Tax=Boletus reticuloceps TaxID=495285 RepID=A0A8I3A8R1_9AGAM|nr:GNS1/SUR4 membrane protein [Boletus reticuloceps]